MEGLWEKLIDVLEEERVLYRDILELSRHKTGTIVEGKVAELEQLTGVEQKLMLSVGGLEQQREETVKQLTRRLNISADELSISTAINQAGNGFGDRLKELKDDISEILKELKNVNDLNSQLIEKSLEYIDFSINIIAGNPSDVTYDSKKGRSVGRNKGGKFFDHKV